MDLQLRRQMQIELKRIQKRLKITFIYITHDQEEALNMSDRIVVMDNGQLEQVGTPNEIYYHPRTSYVARFVGTANILSGRLTRVEDGIAWVEVVCQSREPAVLVRAKLTAAQAEKNQLGQIKPGQKVSMAVRSENILLEKEAGPGLRLSVIEKNFAGGMLRICLDGGLQGELVSSRQGMDSAFQAGDRITAYWEPEHGILVDLE